MDSIIHMRKFFMDAYGNPSMYEEYLNGEVFLNYELYDKWYKEMEQKNKTFARLIRELKRINGGSYIHETALSENLTLSKDLCCKKELEICFDGKPIIEELPLGNSSNHYICNGCYESTLENIYNVLNNGSFTVGICTEKKTDEFRAITKYYGELRSFLLGKGYTTSAFETNVTSKNRVYILMYDSTRNKIKSR